MEGFRRMKAVTPAETTHLVRGEARGDLPKVRVAEIARRALPNGCGTAVICGAS
jgi:hypothetical protein